MNSQAQKKEVQLEGNLKEEERKEKSWKLHGRVRKIVQRCLNMYGAGDLIDNGIG